VENHHLTIEVKNKEDWCDLFFIGDWHEGSIACQEEKIVKDLQKIAKRENPQVWYMGDGIDAICYRDKRFDPAVIHPRYRDHLGDIFRQQVKQLKKYFGIMKHEPVGVHIGNHELACSKYYQYSPHLELLEWFPSRVRDLGYTALTNVAVKCHGKSQYSFDVFSCHGMGSVKTMIPFMNRTKHIQADIYVSGHNHQLEFKRIDQLKGNDEDTPEVESSPKVWAFSGSYLKTFASGITGYGELAGYEPVPLGCMNIKVRQDEKGRLEYEAKTT